MPKYLCWHAEYMDEDDADEIAAWDAGQAAEEFLQAFDSRNCEPDFNNSQVIWVKDVVGRKLQFSVSTVATISYWASLKED